MKTYGAKWGRTLILMSIFVTVLCVGVSCLTLVVLANIPQPALAAVQWLPMALLTFCLPFVVRSYTITDEAILIRRLLWTTRLDRAGLTSAKVLPDAMRGSIRTCGNGGGFSITGWYWSKRLGFYRAFVTDLKRTVVLRFADKTVVLSPDEPADFVRELYHLS